MKNSKKNLKTELLYVDINQEDLNGPILGVIAYLQSIIDSNPNFMNHVIMVDAEYENININVYGDRPLTEKEIEKRKEYAKKNKEKRLKEKEKAKNFRYQQFIKLKKEFHE